MEKETLQQADIENKIEHLLTQIQENLFTKAKAMREIKTYSADTYDEFKKIIEETPGGFLGCSSL